MRIHHHVTIELSLVLSGRGLYKTQDREYPIAAGDVFLFRPNEAHCITDIEAEGMELLNLHIAPYYLYTHFSGALNADYIKILSANFPLLSNKISELLPLKESHELALCMQKIRSEMENKRSDYLTLAHNSIVAILIAIARIHEGAGMKKSEKQNYQRMIAAIHYIDDNFRSNITLEEIAAQIGYNRCYFSHIFSRCMGMSVWDYISIKRIEEALTLIKTSDKNILQIAVECGFNNTINFNKTFKKYTNLSPSAFRK